MKNNYITIAVAKGYLLEESLKLLSKFGYDFDLKAIKNSRKLFYFDNSKSIRLLNVRPWDVPIYVEEGAADFGIVGKDVLLEKDDDVIELLDLKFGSCKLVIAGVKNKKQEYYQNISIASKYPNSCYKYFQKFGINAHVIKMYGAIELAPLTGISDLICDLAASGKTLEENNLEVIDTVFESSARLVANRISLKFNHTFIKSLIKTFNA